MRKQGRKCQGCGETMPREKMFRITRGGDGDVLLDPPSTFTGRSCYICKNPQCVQIAIKKKRVSRALKVKNAEENLNL